MQRLIKFCFSQIKLRILDGSSLSNGNDYMAAQKKLLDIATKVIDLSIAKSY